jgi:hypothetical protein
VTPSDLVLRLMTKSNVVGNMTSRSEGLGSVLGIRPCKRPAWRYASVKTYSHCNNIIV